METKDLIALGLIFLGVLLGTTASYVFPKARLALIFLMICGAVVVERLDVNFFSHYWYRGTTRGVEFSLIDIFAISLLASLLLPRTDRPAGYWPASLALLLVYLAYGCLSVAISEPKVFGLFELSKIVRGIIIFLAAAFFIRGRTELLVLVLALGCATCFEGVWALKQRYLDGIYRVPGSLDHPNSLSMYLCLVGPVFVAAATSDLPRYVRWFAALGIGVATLGILLTISRAGIPVFALVMLGTTLACVSWKITPGKIAGALAICLGLGALVYRSWDTVRLRYAESTFEEEYLDESSEGRGVYFRLAGTVVSERPLGVGLNNWSYWVSKTYGARQKLNYEDYDDIEDSPNKELLPSYHYAAPAHNLAALTVGELGWPGLFLFALAWLRWFQVGTGFLWDRLHACTHRLGVGLFFGLCGVFLQSLTEWVYRQSSIYLTFHILLGTLAALHHRRFLRRAHRRIALGAEPPLQAVGERLASLTH